MPVHSTPITRIAMFPYIQSAGATWLPPDLAASTTPPDLEVFLPHLFASGFSHPFVNSFLRLGLPMTFPGGVDWSPAMVRDRRCWRYGRFSLRRVYSRQVSQQVDRPIPNAAQLGGQCHPLKRTFTFGPNHFDEHAELVCKRDEPLFDRISSQLFFQCSVGHCHDSSSMDSSCIFQSVRTVLNAAVPGCTAHTALQCARALRSAAPRLRTNTRKSCAVRLRTARSTPNRYSLHGLQWSRQVENHMLMLVAC